MADAVAICTPDPTFKRGFNELSPRAPTFFRMDHLCVLNQLGLVHRRGRQYFIEAEDMKELFGEELYRMAA